MELFNTQMATPGTLWRFSERRLQAVHVVAAVTVVTEQHLVIIVAGATQAAGLALNALPGILLHRHDHVVSELQAGGVATAAAVTAGHQLLCGIGLLILCQIPKTKVAVIIGRDFPLAGGGARGEGCRGRGAWLGLSLPC